MKISTLATPIANQTIALESLLQLFCYRVPNPKTLFPQDVSRFRNSPQPHPPRTRQRDRCCRHRLATISDAASRVGRRSRHARCLQPKRAGNSEHLRSLQDGEYVRVSQSRAFPAIGTNELNQQIGLRKTNGDVAVIRAVRQFCRQLPQEQRSID